MSIESPRHNNSEDLARAVRAYNSIHFERGTVPNVLMDDDRPLNATLSRQVEDLGVDLHSPPKSEAIRPETLTVDDEQLGGVYGYIPGIPG